MELPPYLHPVPGGTRLEVFVQPRAAREGLAGVHGEALKLKVAAPAQDDKANRAVLALLARILDLPMGRFAITSGHKSRNKRIIISEASPQDVATRLNVALR